MQETEEELGADGQKSGIEKDDSEELEKDFVEPFNPDEISIESKVVSLDSVLRRIKNNTIRLAPPFQRKSVWDPIRKSRLIESMMLKIPLPMFYVSSDKENNWDVVDGLQRLTTIKEFILGKCQESTKEYDEQGFSLKNLEFWDMLNGKTYTSLPPKLYNNIAETEFRFTVINPDTPEEVKRNIFKRINTGGMPLTAQEIRHALYQGASTKLLADLVNSTEFINAVGKIDDTRMGGRELILRFFSFYIRDYKAYDKEAMMDKFLSDTMRIINVVDRIKFTNEYDLKFALDKEFRNDKTYNYDKLFSQLKKFTIKDLIKDFSTAMIRAKKIFGDHTFRKSYPGKRKTPINKTLFEVFSNLLLELSSSQFDKLLENKVQFIADYQNNYLLKSDFSNTIGKDSHKVTPVKDRYEKLSELLKKYCKE